jgi:phenylacetic acid degradation operon negative regulatory protein
VLLSVLLGSHPPHLPVRTLVRTAALFGITEGATRVALSRLTSDGEVVADGGSYALSDRHLERQKAQDASLRPATRPWRGQWVLVMTAPEADGRAAADPARLRAGAIRARMAEIRPGVWTRPDNLATTPDPFSPDLSGPDLSGPGLPNQRPVVGRLRWTARLEPGGQAADLAARLWDLAGWADQATRLLEQLAATPDPAGRLAVAAAMVRHLRADPVLPAPLLPAGWPGGRLRQVYGAYRTELGELIAGRPIGPGDEKGSAEETGSGDETRSGEETGSGREDSARHSAK